MDDSAFALQASSSTRRSAEKASQKASLAESFFVALTRSLTARCPAATVVRFIVDGQPWTLSTRPPSPPSASVQFTGDVSVIQALIPSMLEASASLEQVHGSGSVVVTTALPATSSSTLAAHWIPDETRVSCLTCKGSFNMFRRRHHCRGCGDVFCADCTAYRVGNARMCFKCFRAAVSSSKATAETSTIASIDIDEGHGDSRGLLMDQIAKASEGVHPTALPAARPDTASAAKATVSLFCNVRLLTVVSACLLAMAVAADSSVLVVASFACYVLMARSLLRQGAIVLYFVLLRYLRGPRQADQAALLSRLARTGPPWHALAHYVSHRPDVDMPVLPPAPPPALPPLSYAGIEQALQQHLGKPLSELFSALDPQAQPAGPFSQAFVATLRHPAGQPAVVDIADPALREHWLRHVHFMALVARVLARVWRDTWLPQLMAVCAEQLRQQVVAGDDALMVAAGTGLPATPLPCWVARLRRELSSVHVTTRLMPACMASGQVRAGPDSDALLQTLCSLYAHAAFECGLLCCDLSCFRITPAAAPSIGLTSLPAPVPQDIRLALARLLVASLAKDLGSALHSLAALGLPGRDIALAKAIMRRIRGSARPRPPLHPLVERPLPLPLASLLMGLAALHRLGLQWGLATHPSHLMLRVARLALVRAFPHPQHARSLLRAAVSPCHPMEPALRSILRSIHGDQLLAGMQVAVFWKDALIVDIAAGTLGPEDPRPVLSDSLLPAMCLDGLLCSMAVLQLWDQGLIESLDMPVSALWPEFTGSKITCTVAQLLGHSAGLHHEPSRQLPASVLCSAADASAHIATATPVYASTDRVDFQPWAVAAASSGLVRAVTRGVTLQHHVRQRIAYPLGVQGELFLGCDGSDSQSSAAALAPRMASLDCSPQTWRPALHAMAQAAAPAHGDDNDDEALEGAGEELTEEHRQYLAVIEQAQREMQAEADSPDGTNGWVAVGEKQAVAISRKSVPGCAMNMMRGTGLVQRPPETVLQLIMDKGRKAEWDTLFRTARVVAPLRLEYEVACEEYRGVLVTSPRDFCMARGVLRLPNGTIVVGARSVEHPACPPSSGFVRANVLLGGFVMRPGPAEGQCTLTYISSVDVRGNLPASIVNKVAMEQPLCVANVRRIVESQPAVAGAVPRAVSVASTTSAESASPSPSPRAALGAPPPAPDASPAVAEYMAVIEQAQREMQVEADSPDGTNGWVAVGEKQAVAISRKSVPGCAMNMMRGTGLVQRPPETVLQLIMDKGRKAEWDTLFRTARVVAPLRLEYEVACEEYRGVLVTSPRDFCMARGVLRLPNGTIVVGARSVEHPACPPSSGFVRAHVILGGFVMRPGPAEGQCTLTYISSVDVRGNLPASIVNKVAMEQPLCVANVRRIVESQPAPLPAAAAASAVLAVAGAPAGGPVRSTQRPGPKLEPSLVNSPEAAAGGAAFLGLRCSARALVRVLAAVAADGSLGGRQLLSPAAARRMRQCGSPDRLGVVWGLGLRGVAVVDPGGAPRHILGNGAPGGSLLLCDPERRLSVCVLGTRLDGGRDAALRIADHVCSFFGVGTIQRDL